MNTAIELRAQNALDPRRAGLIHLGPQGGAPEDRLDLRAIYFALRRQRWVILLTTFLVAAAAVLLTALQTPLYSATASVVLNNEADQIAPKGNDAPATTERSSDLADTEVEVIRSREMAIAVAQGLQLGSDPNFSPALNPQESKFHRLLRFIGLASAPKPVVATPEAIQDAVVSRLMAGLSVQRIGLTYAFNITMTGSSPLETQKIANEYALQYTQAYLTRKQASDSGAVALLSRRLEAIRQQAQADTARVQQYRIANNLMSTSGASLAEQEISNYDQQVATARAEAAEDRARLDTARSQLLGGSKGDDVGEALNSSVISGLRAKRSEVSGRLASLEANFGPLYPDVTRARSELADVDAQINAEIKRIISNLEAKVKVSSDRLASIEGSLGSAKGQLASNNKAMVGLDDLTRRAEASQQLYDSYLAQYKQTSASQGTERPDARVISYAELPLSPISPKRLLNLVLALVVGVGLGIAIALIRELLYSGLTTAADVESRLGVRCLGSVPLLGSVLPSPRAPAAAIVEYPQSGFTEAFRGLRAAIQYSLDGPHQVIMITSALPREGKTTVASCLTRMCALNGEQIVLVDVDVRQRGASRLVDHGVQRPGLVELLRGEAALDDVLVTDPETGANIIPVRGAVSGLGDLLIGERMSQLIDELRKRFSLVILDAAPVLPIADTRSLVSKVDVVVMVARWRATADHAVKTALRLLPSNHAPIAGVVLSQVDVRKQARFGYGDSGLYHDAYKSYYA